MEWVTTTAFLHALKQPGDNEAWRRFVQRFRQPVVRYAERGGLKTNAAEDLAQEVLLTFVESWRDGRYDPSKGRLSSWLFGIASKKLMSKFKSMIPEGSHRARIRAFNREVRTPKEGCLGDTLGDEPDGMVIVDFDGHKMKYDQMRVFEGVIAKHRGFVQDPVWIGILVPYTCP